MKKALFIDRDGTIIVEPPIDFQVDSFEKFSFVPKVISALSFIRKKLDFEFAMVTNQDGLGTEAFPEEQFIGPHSLMINTLLGEGVEFDDQIIDKTFEHENKPTRKPGTALLGKYLSGGYDLENSFVIGDRLSDVKLAKNLGAKAILFQDIDTAQEMFKEEDENLRFVCALITNDWDKIAEYLFAGERIAIVKRDTSETKIEVKLNLDGSGKSNISTGLGFFNHMLDQIARHSGIDLYIKTNGDLYVDEHHTIEDTALALGEALYKALGSKRGIERYGYTLPMDECICTVALDFGGRPWLVWEADFKREKIGEMPTEMFMHFFKSLSDAAKMNLYVKAEGINEHHKIEGIFKALARSIKMAIKRDIYNYQLPSSKGVL
ncbi:MAG: bifunctional histidinol-phosphatase/imidazoleglycerol-phosphate dehydratase HisB [Bacteroidales bacterium]|nr:bifunctional histidinol-phosphatase/imidazoleglycerol-phosphate dehydratase HisB [Bacteroidales bacterium]